jgi:hypothetical protein
MLNHGFFAFLKTTVSEVVGEVKGFGQVWVLTEFQESMKPSIPRKRKITIKMIPAIELME